VWVGEITILYFALLLSPEKITDLKTAESAKERVFIEIGNLKA
jgi:hypothetical protein